MNIIRDFIDGMLSVLKTTSAPLLYRYPYRTSAEGLRSDWVQIGRDIESVMGRLGTESDDGQRTED
jgi:hypothetical protein